MAVGGNDVVPVPALGRITRRPDYLAAAEGRRFHTGRLSAQGRAREPASEDIPAPEGLRVGFTVTKRVGHATERNRIRRRLKAAVAEAAGGHLGRVADVVLIGRRDALAAPFPLLVEDIRRALDVVTRPGSPRGGRRGRPGGAERQS